MKRLFVLCIALVLSGCASSQNSASASASPQTASPSAAETSSGEPPASPSETAAVSAASASAVAETWYDLEPVTVLDDEGITKLLTAWKEANDFTWGCELTAVEDTPEGLDNNNRYAIVVNPKTREEIYAYIDTYLDDSVSNKSWLDEMLFEYNGQLMLQFPNMGYGNYDILPDQWEKASDQSVHAQFTVEGVPVEGIYAIVCFSQKGNRWIVSDCIMPDYDKDKGFINPTDPA